ncbi:MAG TPA: STAS domain-containing protein [Candidatus Obscuribacterales bacterium]
MTTQKIPILKLGEFLLVTIQGELHDTQAYTLQDELSAKVANTNARGVLVDVSGLTIVDSFMGRMISTIAATTRLMDAETVVVGMQPAVAITLVDMGLSLPGISTAKNVDKGMAMLRSKLGYSPEDDANHDLPD